MLHEPPAPLDHRKPPVRRLAGEIEIHCPQDVGSLAIDEEPECRSDAGVYVKQLVGAVTAVEAVPHVDDPPVADSPHESLGGGDQIGVVLAHAQGGHAGVRRVLADLPPGEAGETRRRDIEVPVEHPHRVGTPRDVLLQHDVREECLVQIRGDLTQSAGAPNDGDAVERVGVLHGQGRDPLHHHGKHALRGVRLEIGGRIGKVRRGRRHPGGETHFVQSTLVGERPDESRRRDGKAEARLQELGVLRQERRAGIVRRDEHRTPSKRSADPDEEIQPPLVAARTGRKPVGRGDVPARGGRRERLVVHPVHRDAKPPRAAGHPEDAVLDHVAAHLQHHDRGGDVETAPGRHQRVPAATAA